MKTLFCLIAVAALSYSQQVIQSPDVAGDGHVTFRLRAPNAQRVAVNIEGAKAPLVMNKDGEGIWSVVAGPLAQDYYSYSYLVDGVRLLDPSNPRLVPNLLSPSNYVHVPGPDAQPWDTSDVPHGTVHHHFYRSSVIGDNRDFYVYTPPGYDASASLRYPVLYLLHGFSDDASAWTSVGRANLILDTLISRGQAKPMIIAMPLGYGAPDILKRSGPGSREKGLRQRNYSMFTNALLDEVIPLIERNYRTLTDRDSRAIAGLSMGGAESLLTGLNQLQTFSYIGSFSAGTLSDPDLSVDFPQLTGAFANGHINLLWIACGTDDSLIKNNREIVAWLKARDIRLTAIETPGMHTWTVWRRNLVEFAPLLFRAASPTNAASSSPSR